MDNRTAELLRLLLHRLERVLADSRWAHRASGIRGTLLNALDQFEAGNPLPEKKTQQIMEYGFRILQKAAEEK